MRVMDVSDMNQIRGVGENLRNCRPFLVSCVPQSWSGCLALRRFGTFSFLCLEFSSHTLDDEQKPPCTALSSLSLSFSLVFHAFVCITDQMPPILKETNTKQSKDDAWRNGLFSLDFNSSAFCSQRRGATEILTCFLMPLPVLYLIRNARFLFS
jgi:hypothetical protein